MDVGKTCTTMQMIELTCFHPRSLWNPGIRAKPLSTLARPHLTNEEAQTYHEADHAPPPAAP